MDTQCMKEKMEIKRILDSNEMTMTRVIKDRIYVLRETAHLPYVSTNTTSDSAPGVYKFKE